MLALQTHCRSNPDGLPAPSRSAYEHSRATMTGIWRRGCGRWCRTVLLWNAVTAFMTALAEVCLSRHFCDVAGNETEDFIIYGLTQDCQIFFIRPSQLPLLSTMNVNIYNSYCFSNLVQLHLKSHNSLLLLTKQAGNRMCTLDVQIPPTEMLFGDHLFSYSLLSSLPYASCSHSSPQMFRLEPDLSFLDSVFNDVLYFIDSQSTGALWTIHQFQITADGYLRHLEKIVVNNNAKSPKVWTPTELASEYVVMLDNHRHFLYIRNRFERHLLYECSYDLLFRPNTLKTHYLNTSSRGDRIWLNGMSADQNVLMYTETDKSVSQPVTRLFALNTDNKSFGRCLVYTDYAFDVGLMKTSTLEQMKLNPLPTLEKSKRMSMASVASSNSTTTTKNIWSSAQQPTKTTTIRATTTRTTPKLRTIYSTSTEKMVTSSEFHNDDDLKVFTTNNFEEINFSDEIDDEEDVEQSESLESYDEVVGLMTTLNAKTDSSSSQNISLARDLQNQTSDSVHATELQWRVTSLIFYVVLFVL